MVEDAEIIFWHPVYHEDFEQIFSELSNDESDLVIKTINDILCKLDDLRMSNVIFCNMSFIKLPGSGHRLILTTDIGKRALDIKLESL